MEALKVLSISVGVSLVVAGLAGALVSVALDPLERMRLRWVAREAAEKERKEQVPA